MITALVGWVLLTATPIISPAGAQSLQQAAAAYERGDYATAVGIYRTLAEQGDPKAQNRLGIAYRDGHASGDARDAVTWFRKAAEQGFAEGQFNLGRMYALGSGVARDDEAAVRWYRSGAEQGNANAQTNLGFMYSLGRGVAKDDAVAVMWYRKAAEQGDAIAQSNMGAMYASGRGVAKDEVEALSWYRKSAEQGSAAGQANLGRMYEQGRGVGEDETEAAKWYRKAADQGNATALVRLGQMYESGRGVPQSDTNARLAYRRAADSGDEKAKTLLAALNKERRVRIVLGCLVQIAEWPVRLVRNHLVVDGTINRNKVGVMLDTGAMQTLIVRSQADRLGLPRSQSGAQMTGIGGRSRVETVLIDEVTIEDAVRKNWTMAVAGETDLGGDIGIILGEDFLSRVDVELDMEHNLVRLYEAKGCGDKSLAYWMVAGAGEVQIESTSEVGPEIVFSVLINGQSVKAMLDTGGAVSLLRKSVAARLGITPEMPGAKEAGSLGGIGANQVQAWIAPMATFKIGNEQISNASIVVADIGDRSEFRLEMNRIQRARSTIGRNEMILGMDFLRAHRMLISHSQKKLYFTYSGGPLFRANPVLETRDDTRPEAKAGPAPKTQ